MVRAFLVIVVIVFTFASGGVHKLVPIQDQPDVQISSAHEVEKAGVEKCCDSTKDEADFEKPRCLGDNCVSTIAVLTQPNDYSSVIRRYSVKNLAKINLTRFLRPPIA